MKVRWRGQEIEYRNAISKPCSNVIPLRPAPGRPISQGGAT